MKKTLLRLLFAAVVVVVVTLAVNPPGEFAPLSELALERIVLPDEWLCTWCDEEKIVMPNWEFTDGQDWDYEFHNGYASSINPRDSMYVGIWQDRNNSSWIEIVVADYRQPIRADLAYFLRDPVKIYWKSNMNFAYDQEKITPSDWGFVNLEADEDAVLCGGGDEAGCGGWYYHARYKQYYLLIWHPLALDSRTFERFVEAVTDHFSEEIIR